VFAIFLFSSRYSNGGWWFGTGPSSREKDETIRDREHDV